MWLYNAIVGSSPPSAMQCSSFSSCLCSLSFLSLVSSSHNITGEAVLIGQQCQAEIIYAMLLKKLSVVSLLHACASLCSDLNTNLQDLDSNLLAILLGAEILHL